MYIFLFGVLLSRRCLRIGRKSFRSNQLPYDMPVSGVMWSQRYAQEASSAVPEGRSVCCGIVAIALPCFLPHLRSPHSPTTLHRT